MAGAGTELRLGPGTWHDAMRASDQGLHRPTLRTLRRGTGQHRPLRTVLPAAPGTTVGGMLVHDTRLATTPAWLVPGFPDLRVPAAQRRPTGTDRVARRSTVRGAARAQGTDGPGSGQVLHGCATAWHSGATAAVPHASRLAGGYGTRLRRVAGFGQHQTDDTCGLGGGMGHTR
jgi:hypothetical protein